ncbi:MAG TPA: trigger factor [Candidatus Acidoferrales bacterium]|nr:trigger factor [Candidatus Acidoferrales bacterium]
MTEATCRREIELEIPAENVQKTTEKIARDLARVARIPGFRPGKAPVTLIRRRFAAEIKGEVLESLVPEFLEQALTEKKLSPVTRPEVDKVDFTEAGPLKFRATFEVLPEFELGDYKNLEIEVEDLAAGDAEVDKTLEEMRERAATYVPVEGRTARDGDFVQVKIMGTPAGGGDPIRADNVQCHIGAEETLEAFNENLRGAAPGETRRFETKYPDDYPDEKLKGKTYNYAVEVKAIKEKKLPELNDDFVKEIGEAAAGATTLEELRGKIRERLAAAREEHQQSQAHERILDELVKRHDFPVPEALIEHQMDARLERMVRTLAAQGVDPRAVNVDWVAMRQRQRERAERDVKAEILIDRIATAENVEVSDEELEKEFARLAERSGESAAVIRARLTKEGALDRMKSKLRSDKAIDSLHRTARIQTIAKREK